MIDEKIIDEIYKEKKRRYRKHELKGLFLEVTSRCNARCEHCGSSCGDFIPKDEVTLEELKGVLDEINEKYGSSNIMLFVTGGEPLVRKDLFELMDYANNLGFKWGMTSNGILIDENVVMKMVETNMFSISVSIDGDKLLHESFRKVPGSFEKILKGIKYMQMCPSIRVVEVTTVVNKKNIDKLDDIYKILKENGVDNWRIIPIDPIGRAKDNKDLLLSKDEYKKMYDYILKKRDEDPEMYFNNSSCGHFLGNSLNINLKNSCFYCSTGYEIASILSNGDIFGCPDIPRRKELIQGNIRNDSFVDVWENKFKQFRSINRTSNSKCKKCPDWKSCLGDAFHTWDFEENKPNFCKRKIFE